jgi:hypothetical protein
VNQPVVIFALCLAGLVAILFKDNFSRHMSERRERIKADYWRQQSKRQL